MSKRLHVKYRLFLSNFNEIWNFRDRFSKKPQIWSFIKIRPVGAELFHADRGTDRRTDMTKLIFAFRNIANAPKNLLVSTQVMSCGAVFRISTCTSHLHIVSESVFCAHRTSPRHPIYTLCISKTCVTVFEWIFTFHVSVLDDDSCIRDP